MDPILSAKPLEAASRVHDLASIGICFVELAKPGRGGVVVPLLGGGVRPRWFEALRQFRVTTQDRGWHRFSKPVTKSIRMTENPS
ncbi:hypothetical protein BMS3Bbin02_01453 [bacterium BMS3Bbin02]|nr:hypothetical protein BMS3Bbin02_01453 [bacterium BMS3Bbin02]